MARRCTRCVCTGLIGLAHKGAELPGTLRRTILPQSVSPLWEIKLAVHTITTTTQQNLQLFSQELEHKYYENNLTAKWLRDCGFERTLRWLCYQTVWTLQLPCCLHLGHAPRIK